MKKGISKFLSIVLSAAMVSPMVGMNSANAMVSSEGAAASPKKVIRIDEVETILTEICTAEINPCECVLLGDNNDIEKFVLLSAFELNGFLNNCSGKDVLCYYRCSEKFRDFMREYLSHAVAGDLGLRVIYSLVESLSPMRDDFAPIERKDSETIREQFDLLKRAIVSMISILNYFSKKPTIDKKKINAIDLMQKINEKIIENIRKRNCELLNESDVKEIVRMENKIYGRSEAPKVSEPCVYYKSPWTKLGCSIM